MKSKRMNTIYIYIVLCKHYIKFDKTAAWMWSQLYKMILR